MDLGEEDIVVKTEHNVKGLESFRGTKTHGVNGYQKHSVQWQIHSSQKLKVNRTSKGQRRSEVSI